MVVSSTRLVALCKLVLAQVDTSSQNQEHEDAGDQHIHHITRVPNDNLLCQKQQNQDASGDAVMLENPASHVNSFEFSFAGLLPANQLLRDRS